VVNLDRLINILGRYGATVACAPRDRGVELRSVSLHAPGEPEPLQADVLLALGVTADQAADFLRDTGAKVVVFRFPELTGRAVQVAAEKGCTVLLADRGVAWGELAGVVYGLVFEGRETEAGRGPTDLFALADALAESVGAPVTIEDRLSGVLAYSSRQFGADRARRETILGRRVPEAVRQKLRQRGVFRHLETSDEPFYVEPWEGSPGHGREVVAIRAGKELLGSVWVETPRPLNGLQKAALVSGARAAVQHLLRMRASADLERQVESDLVTSLLEGYANAPAMLSRLGFQGDQFRVVAVQARGQAEPDAAALLVFERATKGFGWSRMGRSALFANTVYTILPWAEASKATRWVAALARDLPEDISVLAGVGSAAGAAEIVHSRREADESVALHSSRADGSVAVVYDEAWHEILLRRLRHVAVLGRVPHGGPVADLIRHDNQNGTCYADTLRAWLECQGDVGDTAARLNVHPNTVRYRMRKMAEVTELRLDDPDARLAMTIALAVL
jgi:hypothetical protein